MTIFLSILWNNVIPLSVMIALGITLHRVFSLDIKTLSKLNFYLFSPAVIFNLLYTTDITVSVLLKVLLFFFVFMLLLYGCVEVMIRLRGTPGGMRGAVRNSVLFYNSANYGIPLNQLAFASNPYTLSVQVLIMMMQSLIPNTYGIYNVNAHKLRAKDIRRTILGQPVIYAIPLGFLFHTLQVPIPQALSTPLGYLANAFIGTALITLGVQLGSIKLTFRHPKMKDVLLACGLRLIGGPLLALAVVWLMRTNGFTAVDALMAKALIVSSSVPTSLSSVLLAVEFDNEPEFASQVVLLSATLSIATVTAVIYFLRI
ncbi:AEC family transporter [Paenibacillus sp. MWE-103]|uniref:AEC family transporter n=1 Tax=Paenibacillus artemisiicola TaxID=1172618 RepID=A0ABS3WA43_9BACL|nr:AEC family transporter [Paenibacillus artemisiicola]MBO7745176.1 AEC family transporter [Paenibacillus artemisiicola]